MAYTPVPTVSTGGSWTAQDMNRYVKDNFAAGIPDLMTTKGDIVAATGGDAGERVAVGANNEFLIADDGASSGVGWSKPAGFRATGDGSTLYVVTYQTWIPLRDTVTPRSFYITEEFDSEGVYSNSNDRFTAAHGGYYLVGLSAGAYGFGGAWALGQEILFAIYKNGSRYSIVGSGDIMGANVFSAFYRGIDIVKMSAGDYLEGYIYIDYSSGNKYRNNTAEVTNFWAFPLM